MSMWLQTWMGDNTAFTAQYWCCRPAERSGGLGEGNWQPFGLTPKRLWQPYLRRHSSQVILNGLLWLRFMQGKGSCTVLKCSWREIAQYFCTMHFPTTENAMHSQMCGGAITNEWQPCVSAKDLRGLAALHVGLTHGWWLQNILRMIIGCLF